MFAAKLIVNNGAICLPHNLSCRMSNYVTLSSKPNASIFCYSMGWNINASLHRLSYSGLTFPLSSFLTIVELAAVGDNVAGFHQFKSVGGESYASV